MAIQISAAFDGGNIECLDSSDPQNVRLLIRKDNSSDFYQWFYFRVTGAKGEACQFKIENAADAAYPAGWPDYRAVISYDLETWIRTETRYQNGSLEINLTPEYDSVYVAYFAPYQQGRHHKLIATSARHPDVSLSVLGKTLDGRDMDLLTIGGAAPGKPSLWFTARQHPGETMAEWWMEGFLERFLSDDPVARQLRESAVSYVVPNMNPDGSARGHLRTNAAGVNLNREWQAPSMDKSPEVALVLAKMHETGVDFALDVHGDEALPYNFIAGTEGIPGFTPRLQSLLDGFKARYVEANADFQTQYGYPVNPPGKANLKICSNAIAQAFDCLAMTLEMPFKDNKNRPDEAFGWSPERAKQLGADVIDVVHGQLKTFRAAD